MRDHLELKAQLPDDVVVSDFDAKRLRPFLRRIGAAITKDARKRISSSEVSTEGQYPGMDTGAMRRAIRVKLFKSGYGLKVYQDMPKKPGAQDHFFYPAFLRYGAKNKNKPNWRIKPRKNYIEDAANDQRQSTMLIVKAALEASLKEIWQL